MQDVAQFCNFLITKWKNVLLHPQVYWNWVICVLGFPQQLQVKFYTPFSFVKNTTQTWSFSHGELEMTWHLLGRGKRSITCGSIFETMASDQPSRSPNGTNPWQVPNHRSPSVGPTGPRASNFVKMSFINAIEDKKKYKWFIYNVSMHVWNTLLYLSKSSLCFRANKWIHPTVLDSFEFF